MTSRARNSLLTCGILASALYVGMNVFIPMYWDGFSHASRVVSELSAFDTPTRSVWVLFGVAYALLVAAFGLGVWSSAGTNRALRTTGVLLAVYGLFNVVPWPPMHQREVLAAGGGTMSDTLHIVWSAVAVAFMLVATLFGAAATGRAFRVYSIITVIVMILFGAATAMQSSALEANRPTPFIGVWERISIGAFLTWMVVLAIREIRRQAHPARAQSGLAFPAPALR